MKKYDKIVLVHEFWAQIEHESRRRAYFSMVKRIQNEAPTTGICPNTGTGFEGKMCKRGCNFRNGWNLLVTDYAARNNLTWPEATYRIYNNLRNNVFSLENEPEIFGYYQSICLYIRENKEIV